VKKKLLVSLLLAACTLVSLGGAAWADGQTASPYVTDAVGLLTPEECQALESQAGQIADAYGCAPYILVVENFQDYEDTADVFEAGMALYTRWDMGSGAGKNGVLLLLSMAERDYALVSYGSLTHGAVTDYGQKYLEEHFLEYFRNDDWLGGFQAYLDGLAWLLEQAQSGAAYDVNSAPRGFQPLIVIVPLGIALLVCGVFAAQMKTAGKQTQARNYIQANGVEMRIVQDHFSHRTVTRQVIRQNNGGGGGTTINSRGFSGRSGKF